jgi:hypothetical protein
MPVVEQCLSPDTRQCHVHSRNSSKTLKCPKCIRFVFASTDVHGLFFVRSGNWHYKYQETLEIHMKEKHPVGNGVDAAVSSSHDGETNCSYCLSNSVHPRLARGEQYPCGFKPYRCDLCLYSTTTKGNLAIHMQSDKHMNNSRDFSSPSLIGTGTTSLATCSPDNSLDRTVETQGSSRFFTRHPSMAPGRTSTVRHDSRNDRERASSIACEQINIERNCALKMSRLKREDERETSEENRVIQ